MLKSLLETQEIKEESRITAEKSMNTLVLGQISDHTKRR